MKVETIHYERKTSDGAYGNRSLAAMASVDAGEDVALAMGQLILLVRGRLAQDEAEEQEEMARYRAEQDRRRGEHTVAVSEADPFGEGAHGEDEEDEDEDEEEEPARGRAIPF